MKCPKTNHGEINHNTLKVMWYSHKMEYYSAIKMNYSDPQQYR